MACILFLSYMRKKLNRAAFANGDQKRYNSNTIKRCLAQEKPIGSYLLIRTAQVVFRMT